MPRYGVGELLVVLLIIMLLFGARRLPELAKAIGQALKEFRKAGQEDVSNESAEKS